MRGPLNSISAWAQLLRSGRLAPDATDQALAAIVRGVHAETQILDDVLDLARISSGSAQLEARPLTLTTVLSGAIDSVDSSASSKGVEIRRPIPSQASVIGDAERLRQVFTNLLSNAIRFTPAGGYVEVEVDERDTEVEVRVNDTGQGIAPDVLPQLFERAAAASADLPVGGAGLGLSIVKSLVQRHGGAVRAASAGPGRGATFAVRLPITVTG
jgi:signal transduction histidine kinase